MHRRASALLSSVSPSSRTGTMSDSTALQAEACFHCNAERCRHCIAAEVPSALRGHIISPKGNWHDTWHI